MLNHMNVLWFFETAIIDGSVADTHYFDCGDRISLVLLILSR